MKHPEQQATHPAPETDARRWPWRRLVMGPIGRVLIVVVLVVGGGVGWFVRSARIQREAVAAVNKLGGGVSYNWIWANEDPFYALVPPEWMSITRSARGRSCRWKKSAIFCVTVPSGLPGKLRFRLPLSIGEVRVPARKAG